MNIIKRAKNLLGKSPEPTAQKVQKTQKAPAKKPKYDPQNEFTVVTAVYNVAPYLDDYFNSLYKQTMKRDKLHVIVVDDGSTDNSAQIIKAWQEKWPNAIRYIYQENAGQASARNTGLEYVQTEWVTFIDSDDFVSKGYFEKVDRAIVKHPDAQFLACNQIFYREGLPKDERVDDSHPLNYRFKKGDRFYSVENENRPFHMPVNSAFMRMSQIRRHDLSFDVRVKPVFEDGNFIARYMFGLEQGVIGFIKNARYYYRKRADASSTLDGSWGCKERYYNVPYYGYLSVLKEAKARYGYVPGWLQNTMLYEHSWVIKTFEGRPNRTKQIERLGMLEQYKDLTKEIFSFIDLDRLYACRQSWISFERKYAIATLFKGVHEAPKFYSFLTGVNTDKKQLIIRSALPHVQVYLDGNPVEPIDEKSIPYDFLGETWIVKKFLRIAYEDENQVLEIRGDGFPSTMLSVPGTKAEAGSFTVGYYLDRFTAHWDEYPQDDDDLWVFVDRDNRTDDNAEHMYRWLKQNHPEQKCVYALKKGTPDWKRLEDEGFELVDFGSSEHEDMLRRCSTIVSAHADAYVHSYFGDNFHRSKRIVFLQHGVIVHDLSSWLNNKPLSLFVTTTPAEHASIAGEGSPYTFLPSDVVLTGLPRHDALLQKAEECRKEDRIIFITPTWRNYYTGEYAEIKVSVQGHEQLYNPAFAKSAYRKNWEKLLNDSRLKEIADTSGCEIVIYPHPRFVSYVERGELKLPSWVHFAQNCEGLSIQDYFARAAVCITDYSSMSSEVALLGKPVLYYQFDKDEYYIKNTSIAHGYFDFERDGFGPVAYDEESAINALEELAKVGFKTPDLYRERIEKSFIFRDGKCCERVYEAIKAL